MRIIVVAIVGKGVLHSIWLMQYIAMEALETLYLSDYAI